MALHPTSDYDRTDGEDAAVQSFLQDYFDTTYSADELSGAEQEVVRQIVEEVDNRFSTMKYVLGIALDFSLLAHQVSGDRYSDFEPELTTEDIFARHEQVTRRGDRELNTLTLRGPGGTAHGIRKNEESVLGLFHDDLNRLDYPSAYVYNTGQWEKFGDLLELCFKLSDGGRYVAVEHLIGFGLGHMARAEEFGGNTRPRLFSEIIEKYPRGEMEGENGGVIFQGIVYGYIKADRPHLSITADKVRVGSARQKRIGDIDTYLDVKVEMSIEVKDFRITEGQYQKELSTFVEGVQQNGIRGTVIARDFDQSVRAKLEDAGVIARTEEELLKEIEFWDWPKQDAAVRGLLHYLAHVEQNTDAVERLQWFIREIDPDHDSLQGFSPENEEPPAYQQELQWG